MSTTYINFLLDRTGSMETIRDATIDGFNEFLKGQRKTPGKTRWTLTLFDSENPQEVVFDLAKGRQVPKLTRDTYEPRSMTPLYDAVGMTLTAALKHAKGENYDGHIFIIMTDGLENASREWTMDQVQDLVQKAEKRDWQVIFLGANQDAWAVGQSLGVVAGSTVTYAATAASVGSTMSSVTDTANKYRSTGETVSSHVDTTDGDIKDQEKEPAQS